MITLVMGGQFGSEGKGSVVSWLARHQHFDLAVRTGGANAGHTFLHKGEVVKMRQIPCTWSAQPDTPVYLASGSVVDVEVFTREFNFVRNNGFAAPVSVSGMAAIVTEEAKGQERGIMTGTTGEGIGATRAARAVRQAILVRDSELQAFVPSESRLGEIRMASRVLVESTQGFGLSSNYSYPFCTSTNLTAMQILSDADVPFSRVRARKDVDVWLVIRMFPIRIAGASGPLWNETSWDALRLMYGNHIPDEQTTVTKKTRRVGLFDATMVRDAIRVNDPDKLVLTFVDYVFPDIARTGVTDAVDKMVRDMEGQIGRKFTHLGIGTGVLISRNGG